MTGRYYTALIEELERIPRNGEIVQANAAGAIWVVKGHELLRGDRVQIALEPWPAHDVPFGHPVLELPNVNRAS
jgi:hypothetical protein